MTANKPEPAEGFKSAAEKAAWLRGDKKKVPVKKGK